jgi:hypothetical protein
MPRPGSLRRLRAATLLTGAVHATSAAGERAPRQDPSVEQSPVVHGRKGRGARAGAREGGRAHRGTLRGGCRRAPPRARSSPPGDRARIQHQPGPDALVVRPPRQSCAARPRCADRFGACTNISVWGRSRKALSRGLSPAWSRARRSSSAEVLGAVEACVARAARSRRAVSPRRPPRRRSTRRGPGRRASRRREGRVGREVDRDRGFGSCMPRLFRWKSRHRAGAARSP